MRRRDLDDMLKVMDRYRTRYAYNIAQENQEAQLDEWAE